MAYFNGITNLADLKSEYRKLIMIHHPDKGGDLETMKAINNEHDKIFAQLKAQHNENPVNKEKQMTETPDQFRNVVVALFELGDLDIELCGQWLWITGDTRPHKEALKQIGCLWAPKKMMWYWRAEEFKSAYSKKGQSMASIRDKYGSQNVKFTPEIRLS